MRYANYSSALKVTASLEIGELQIFFSFIFIPFLCPFRRKCGSSSVAKEPQVNALFNLGFVKGKHVFLCLRILCLSGGYIIIVKNADVVIIVIWDINMDRSCRDAYSQGGGNVPDCLLAALHHYLSFLLSTLS